MILYIENPKDATRKLLELINEFGKVAGYKINAPKSLVFLYTNDEKSESEIKETPGRGGVGSDLGSHTGFLVAAAAALASHACLWGPCL